MAEKTGGLPRWLGPASRAIVVLQRRGLAIGTMRLLSVPGRRSGRLRTTPASPLRVDGRCYIVAGLEGTDWVENARAAVLREFPDKVPGGVQFFRELYGVSRDPEEFVALAPRCPVFRVEGGP